MILYLSLFFLASSLAAEPTRSSWSCWSLASIGLSFKSMEVLSEFLIASSLILSEFSNSYFSNYAVLFLEDGFDWSSIILISLSLFLGSELIFYSEINDFSI